MSATSRRSFLASAAAAAGAVCASGCDPAPPSSNSTPPAPSATPPAPGNQSAGVGNTAPPCAPGLIGPADQKVAMDFLRYPRFLDPAMTGASSVFLMYGLVCVDFGTEKELVFPTTNGVGSGVHAHQARLWLPTAEVDAGSDAPDGSFTESAENFRFWNLEGRIVSIQALDGANTALAEAAAPLTWRNNDQHPWNNQKWVRCLGSLTGKTLISGPRNDTTLVASRMRMTNGSVVAIPPFTERGRNIEWKVTKTGGGDVIQSTTDAMVWQRAYTGTVSKFKITLTPMSGSGDKVINVKQTAQKMVAVVTHAMTGSLSTPDLLTDTRAFAKILTGGVAATHPTPQAHKNSPDGLFMSGSDGHCECACN